jgi:TP901 family phage tail tape measure protein
MVKANFELEEGMARIETVMYGTGAEVQAQMAGIKRVILDTSTTTRISIKDLAEAFYFLKTSALSAEEAMAGFAPLVSILTGTNVSAQEASRGLAGMYNTLGESLGSNLTVSEKMTKIADTLTYTYAKQDVEMGELISSYSKLAPYLAGLDDNFTDIVTTLGFLNTHLLRSSRAGTLTGQAIMNMTKSSKQLASIFDITFDPNQPMNFLEVLDRIHTKMGDTTKLTTAQSEAIAKISATRGGVPIRLLLGNYDEFKATLKDAQENVDGYAKKIAEIRMGTVTAQMSEMKNILAVLTNDFISGVYGVGDFAEALKMINETMVALRPNIQGLGMGIGWVGEQMGVALATAEAMARGDVGMINQLGKQVRGFGAFVDEQLRLQTDAQKKQKEGEKFTKAEKEGQEFKINAQKEYEETLKSTYEIMKANGANELDIQKAKVSEFEKAEAKMNKIASIDSEILAIKELQKSADGEASYTLQARIMLLQQELTTQTGIQTIRDNFGSDADYMLAKQKEENELLKEQVKYRKEITDNLRNVAMELMKSLGTSEADIITLKMRELEVDRQKMGEASYLAQSEALRLQRIQAIVSEKLKERQVQAGLIMEYQKADEFEKARIRRLIELRKLSSSELEKQYKESPADARLIESQFSKLKPEQQEVVIKAIAEKNNLEYEDVKDIITDTARDNPLLADNNNALRDLTDILRALNQNIGVNNQNPGVGYASDLNRGQTIEDRIAVDANVDLRTAIANINIMLPDNALQQVAEEAGKAVTDALTSNEELAKKIAKIIRPYV